MANLMTDEFVEELSQTVDQTIKEVFNGRIINNAIYHADEWWILVYVLGAKERVNINTQVEEIYYFFEAVKTEDIHKKRIDSTSNLHLITLPHSEVQRRQILHRKFKL